MSERWGGGSFPIPNVPGGLMDHSGLSEGTAAGTGSGARDSVAHRKPLPMWKVLPWFPLHAHRPEVGDA